MTKTLFDAADTNPTVDLEIELAENMARQWDVDQGTVAARGVHPDWLGEPKELSGDKARLLSYVYENGYIQWSDRNTQVRNATTKAIGLHNSANARAVIEACLDERLIEPREWEGMAIYQMTTDGEIALDDYFLEREVQGVDMGNVSDFGGGDEE